MTPTLAFDHGDSIRFGFFTNAIGWTFDQIRSAWKLAEKLGFDSAHMMDNAVGPAPWAPTKPMFETMTVLSALAEATSRIRFGPLVSPAGRRHPALFAKMTSILDVVSEGRLILGLGAGDDPRHYLPWGLPFADRVAERMARLEEEIHVIRSMWTEESASFRGKHYVLDEAVNAPKPVQRPSPPIWIGTHSSLKRMPSLAAQHADGIIVYGASDETASTILDRTRQACEQIGRNPYEVLGIRHVHVILSDGPIDLDEVISRQVARPGMGTDVEGLRSRYERFRLIVGPPAACIGELETIRALGFDYIVLQFMGPDDPVAATFETTCESMDAVARDVLPALGG